MNIFLKSFVIILTLIILAAGGFFVSRFVFKPEPIITEKTIAPTGKIYLTLKPLNSDSPAIYTLNLANNTLAKYSADNYLTSKFSPDKQYLAFINFVGNIPQIFLSKNGNKKFQVTTSSQKGKRLPQWSPDGKLIAFHATDGQKDVDNPDNWNVYTIDENDNENFITTGSFPFFTPDGRILVMKSDGIYVTDTKERTAERIIKPTGENKFTTVMKMSLSPDGNYFSLSSPGINKVYLYKISSWQTPIKINLDTIISAKAFWSIFSPDSKLMALQEIDTDLSLDPNHHPRIVIYDIETLKGKIIYNLNEYSQEKYMYMTDWQ